MRLLLLIRFFCCMSLTIFLTACGGGGGGGGSGNSNENFSISTSQLIFQADIDAPTPSVQIVSGTVRNVNTSVRVDIIIDGTAIESADFNFVGSNSGELLVQVKPQEELGVGNFSDQIRVYVCTDLAGSCEFSPNQISGSPKTINVSYNITATPTVRYIVPMTAQPNTSGDAIIRGVGFSLLSSPTVNFGSTDALSVNIINDTEIRATFPALPAGEYPVNVIDMSGTIVTEASLTVAAETSLGYAFLADTGEKTKVIFDAIRTAIYVGNKTSGLLLRYEYTGTDGMGNPIWTNSTLPIANIHDIALTPDGNTLTVLSEQDIVHVDLDTFSTSATIGSPLSHPILYLGQIAIANNGMGIVVPRIHGSGSSFFYKYNIRKRTFKALNQTVAQGTVGVSGDGSKVLIASETSTSFIETFEYNPTTDADPVQTAISENASVIPMDYTGNTAMFGVQNFLNDQHKVYKNQLLQGTVPGSNANYINHPTVLSADGNYLYKYSPQANQINIYDLTASDGAGSFNQTPGSPIAVTDSAGNTLALTMELTPFGNTLFIAGDLGVVVQPLN